MPTAIYDSSLITKRNQSKAISGSFINRIENPINPTTSYGPLAGIYDQSIVNSVNNGHMTEYRRNEGNCTILNAGCPCLPPSISPPTPIYGWATQLAAPRNSSRPNSMTFDSTKSNFYMSGSYDYGGVLTIYNSNGSIFLPSLPASPGLYLNGFIVKYDILGNAQWAAPLIGTGTNFVAASVVDSDNNLIVSGRFNGTLTIYNKDNISSGLTLNATIGDIADVFIIKYNPNGSVIWATTITGIGGNSGNYIVTDSNNNIYVSGDFISTITINSTNGSSFPINYLSTSGTDTFLVKYTKDGIGQRGTLLRSSGTDTCYAMAMDSLNNIYMYGSYSGSALSIYNAQTPPLQPVITTTSLALAGGADIFLIKYTSELQLVWATRMSSAGTELDRNLTIDSNNNIYLTGAFGAQMTFYNSGGTQIFRIIPAPVSLGAFVAVYNTNGIGNWVAYMDSVATDIGVGISYDSIGNVYVSGIFQNTLTAYNINGTTNFTLTSSANQDIFLIKYNASGFVQWITKMSSPAGDNTVSQLLVDSNNYLYISGTYGSGAGAITLTFFNSNGLPSGVTVATTSATNNMFAVKYNSNGFLITA
jgi:hypothetical protein